ncbi:MAG TPA: S9 family peptidase [Actinomycetota bacterium]
MPIVAPYGAWRSPISPDMVAGAAVPLMTCRPAGGGACWLEGRPLEGGRMVLVRRAPDGRVHDVTPPGFNVRTRVHEYGGMSFTVRGEDVFFSNFDDQRLYRQPLDGGDPVPIVAEPAAPAAHRYGDLDFTPDGARIYCVRERHEDDGVFNELVTLPADGSAEPVVVADGNDFYSFPRVSPDGRLLAWTTWNHPNMPWDGTELWVAELSGDGGVSDPRLVAGGPDESVFQPEWSPGGVLHFVSDRTGWWNLFRERSGAVEDLMPMEADFGFPQWLLDESSFAFVDEERIACAYVREGHHRLALLHVRDGHMEDLDVPYTHVGITMEAQGTTLYFVGASSTQPPAAISLDLATGHEEVLRRSLEVELDPGYLSVARPISFPTEGGMTAHALFYAPANPDHQGPPEERPPLLVLSHGGPTGMTAPILNLGIQFWTSRGFAVVDVNYRGSTGYGRAYRDALKGLWGVADVEDCVNAALYLAEAGEADGRRLAIRGGSAGGYTTLCAITFRDDFAAGASYYGIGDLETMVRDTHKFESRYLDRLVGPYPEAIEVYRERSPVHHVDRISTPVIMFQGLEDEVVPPNQAEDMARALRARGVPFAYLAFEGEQHGFRKAETNRRCLEAELYFYSKVLGFDLPDTVEPVEIENLP